jgi:hypothetical protein
VNAFEDASPNNPFAPVYDQCHTVDNESTQETKEQTEDNPAD